MIKAIVFSDSHGQQAYMKQKIKDESPFDVLIHAGDLEDTLEGVLGPVDYHTHIVKGNCDYGRDVPLEKIFKLGGRTVLLLHGHSCNNTHCHPGMDMNRMVYYAQSKGCDMLIYGHTHIPHYEELDDGFIILNPGSISLPRQSDMKKMYAVLEVEDKEVTVTHKSYEN